MIDWMRSFVTSVRKGSKVCQPRLTTCREDPYAPRVEVTPREGEDLLVKGTATPWQSLAAASRPHALRLLAVENRGASLSGGVLRVRS